MRFFKNVKDEHKKQVNKTEIPKRSSNKSAGYDFYNPKEIIINPGETKVIWTDIKARMEFDEVLMLYVRSSIGIKRGLVLANGTGIIDSDYFENKDNDGNIGIALINVKDKPVILKENERFAQGIFMKYLVADDDNCDLIRAGGIGSSGK
jgi:dUTP pyrophosphatase